ncbi:DUF3783 domain-containing protein [Anaerostipes sp.]|uniref:DUF3783 domain-containing protein n=1 Tax=Anaerostipes sp. TaxID=1872530 RepID=UPI0025BB3401|nr:DUF3783 domain-containing protein [Anaerostipes sp.]MBS7009753.1 DUF3783 domain-containing protein [Anaerostipes sp.]
MLKRKGNSGKAVLLYNLDNSDRARKIKYILIRMGVRIKNVKKEDYLKPIGALAGAAGAEADDSIYDGPGFAEEMLVMKGFTGREIDELILRFRKEKLDKIDLKAVMTDTNQTWDSITLYENLREEHEQMTGE